MIDEFILKENIMLHVNCNTWEEAIRIGGELLVKNEYITAEYVNQMIESVNSFGPYIVIAPHIALAHARPSKHVLKDGLSMITLKRPVIFANKTSNPVKIVFSFCAKSNETHLKILRKLVAIIEDNPIVEEIINSSDVGYVYHLISSKEVKR